MFKKRITFFLFVSLIISCGEEYDCKDIDTEEELEACDVEINVEDVLEQFRVKDSDIRDYITNEGLYYIPLREKTNGKYYDIIDKNSDSVVDEYVVTDGMGKIFIAKVDSDFDGTFETSVKYFGDVVSNIYVDSNQNGINDIVDVIEHGEILSSERYYESGHIGKVEYKFGYPVGNEVLVKTDLTEEEFEKSHNAKITEKYELPEKYKSLKGQ